MPFFACVSWSNTLIAWRAARGDGRQGPISATDDFFTQVMDRFELPRVFVQSVSSNQGSLASFVGYEMVGKEHHPAYLCESTAKLLDLEGSDF